MNIPEDSAETLKSIESLLSRHLVSPKLALDAAYSLGKVDGQLEMTKVCERTFETLGEPQ